MLQVTMSPIRLLNYGAGRNFPSVIGIRFQRAMSVSLKTLGVDLSVGKYENRSCYERTIMTYNNRMIVP
jgi:hypothetical protein